MEKPEIAQKAPFPTEVEAGKSYFWCACGKSSKQPFCDGSHSGTEFSPVKYTAERDGRVFFVVARVQARFPSATEATASFSLK